MNPKGNNTFLEPLTNRDDIIALYDELLREDQARGGQPAHVIFAIGIFCGFRIGDIMSLRIAHVCSRGKSIKGEIRLRERKRGRTVERALTSEARGILRKYVSGLDWQRVKYQSLLFESPRQPGRPYSAGWFYKRLKEAAVICGIEQRIATHTMRKTFARLIYDLMVEDKEKYPTEYEALQAVSAMLRHKKTSTTALYIGINREREAEMIGRLDGYFKGSI